jgi:hypothetical protein
MYSIENGVLVFAFVGISLVAALGSPTLNCLALDYLAGARLRV